MKLNKEILIRNRICLIERKKIAKQEMIILMNKIAKQ